MDLLFADCAVRVVGVLVEDWCWIGVRKQHAQRVSSNNQAIIGTNGQRTNIGTYRTVMV